jgi:hypothetical protein
MRFIIEKSKDGNGFFNMLEIEDFEYVNPMEKEFETRCLMELWQIKNTVALKPELIEPYNKDIGVEKAMARLAFKRGYKEFNSELAKLNTLRLPEGLMGILNLKKKKAQEKVLSKISLSTSLLTLFVYKAFEDHGFTYSMYTASAFPNVDIREMPPVAYVNEEGGLETTGNSNLTEGQIRGAIEQRQTTIAKFLDKGNQWHCFFYTYKSLGGKETRGVAHIHYISHAWGLKREEVLQQIKNGKYNLPRTPHIPYERYL